MITFYLRIRTITILKERKPNERSEKDEKKKKKKKQCPKRYTVYR